MIATPSEVAFRRRFSSGLAVVSGLAGALLGLALFSSTLSAEQRRAAPELIHASVEDSDPAGEATYILPDGERVHWARAEAQRYFQDALGGRSLSFLLRQLAWRAIPLELGGILMGLILGTRIASAQLAKRTKRGPVLRDLAVERRRRRRARAILATAGGFVITGLLLGADRIQALGDYCAAGQVANTGLLSSWLSLDGRVWVQAIEEPGLYPPAAVLDMLAPRFLGLSPVMVIAGSLSASLLLARGILALAAAAPALARRSPGYFVADVPVPPGKECHHFLFTGSPGAGKSTAIKALLDQVRARGVRAVIYDLNGEYVDRYYRPSRDHILNPLDERGVPWTPWAEARGRANYTAMARSLFPHGGKDPFWADAGATLFASTLEALARSGRVSNSALYKALTKAPLADLHEFLKDTPAARFLDDHAGAMPSNLLATVTSRLEAWSILSDRDAEPFSIRSFIEGGDKDDGWLFLATREDQAALMKPLLSLWADVVATSVLSLGVTDHARLWIVLDELASLQRLPALPGLLERGRKHGAAVVLGLQAMPQLRDAYGSHAAAALAAQPQTWLVLRSVEPDTARWLENALGHVEIEELHPSMSVGRGGDSVAVQSRSVVRPLVLASEIATLPDHTGAGALLERNARCLVERALRRRETEESSGSR